MLRHTFCHLPGVGPKTEQSLWKAGIHTWEDVLTQDSKQGRRAGKRWAVHLEESVQHFADANPAYFAGKLAANQTWRLFKDFRDSCVFLDIETTGLGGFGDHVTTIALYDGRKLRTYVHGVNLDDFPREIQDYKLIVTYNGASFDIPFLEHQFHTTFRHAHIDLRYVLRNLGLTGGLKRCEKLAGIARPGLEDVDGYAAVLLWHEYRRHRDSRALETLLAYNAQDTLNLEPLMILAFNRKVRETPFADLHCLGETPSAENPYRADARIVAKVVDAVSWRQPSRW